jgi:hypothetical protein
MKIDFVSYQPYTPHVLEKAIQNQILVFLNMSGIFCWQNDSVGVWDPTRKVYRKSHNKYKINGVSDILGVFHGRFLAIEVKSKVGKLTESQKAFLENVRDNGGIAILARSVSDVANALGLRDPFKGSQ